MPFPVPAARYAALALALAMGVDAAPSQAAEDGGSSSPAGPGDHHQDSSGDIVVTAALPVNRVDALSGVAVLSGQNLAAATRPSLGETLVHTPGVSASSFGPSASRPILRGLDGERVRVLTDGIGSIDVSNTSADHATVVDPLLADRIEVLRGPQSLLYGSAAIGGVVNVISRRIPTRVPDEPIHIGGVATLASAAHERALSGAADAPLGGGWVLHADGSYAKSDDLRIGGYALTPALRAEALASSALASPDEAEAFAANAAVSGRLPNTAARTWNAGAGLAWIGSGGTAGLAYSHHDSLYGVPIRLATQPGQDQEAPRLQMRQDRIDARAAINLGGSWVDKITLRGGYADYRHAELDQSGAVGTQFFNKGAEIRLEVTQAKHGAWQGATGAQAMVRKFDVVGDEAFLPKNDTRQLGLFSVQQVDLGAVKLELGGRYEHTRVEGKPQAAQPQFFAGVREFDAFSLAGGAAWTFAPGWRLGLNLSRTERAPAAEELFANGAHAGTATFEIGEPALMKERATGIEAILRGGGDGWKLEASAYHTWFGNFIFSAPTGQVEDGLPVFVTRQADARYWGFEVEGSATLAEWGGSKLEADVLGDYVHATIEGQGPAPRIPPLRVLGGLTFSSPSWDLRGEVEHVTAQSRVAAFETPTPGYTMVNAEIGWRPWGKARPLSLTLSANNLFDVNARRHASVLKDYAPLAGRDIRLTAKLEL